MTTRTNLLSALTAAQTRQQTAKQIVDAISKANIAGPAKLKVEKDLERATAAVTDATERLAEWDGRPKSAASLAGWLSRSLTGEEKEDAVLAAVAQTLASWLGLPDEDPEA